MSTIKTDTITAVNAGGDLSLDGLGTGGVSIASTLKMTKGGDIASASPLVIDTDGNYFDVTGTTSFAAMTVESGNFFMLQFDGALTITHGSGIELPGATNLTTAAGDRLICYATAANTVEVMSVELETAASAGGITLGTEQASTSGSDIVFTGIPSGTKRVTVNFAGVSRTDASGWELQIGDAGGLETSGYIGGNIQIKNGTAYQGLLGTCWQIQNETLASETYGGSYILTLEDSSDFTWCMSGGMMGATSTGVGSSASGYKSLTAELDRVNISAAGGAFDGGAINITYE